MANKKIEMEIASAQDFADAILQARLASGQTQQETADQSDIHRVYLSRMETGDIAVIWAERYLEVARNLGAKITFSFEGGGD